MVDPLQMTPGSNGWRLWCLRLSLMYAMIAYHSDKFERAPDAAAYLDERGLDSWEELEEALTKTVTKARKK